MREDCNEEEAEEGQGITTKALSNFSSATWDSLVPRVRSFRSSNIPKKITTFDQKRPLRCFELIRGYAFKAAASKFTSKVDALPEDPNNNLQKCAETELIVNSTVNFMKSPVDPDSNNTKIGLLRCKWKNGVPQHRFTVDDKREIFAADLTKEASSAVDCVYTFRSSKGNKIIGKMEVSTSITIGWGNTGSSEETKSVLSVITSDDEHMTEEEEEEIRMNEKKQSTQNLEMAAIVIKRASGKTKAAAESGGWGLKFLTKLPEKLEGTRSNNSNDDCSTSMNVLIPEGIHGGPRKASGLTERWASGGGCDCGGWDVACPLTVLGRRSNGSDDFDRSKSVDLYVQGSKRDLPALKMVKMQEDLYCIRFGSNLSTLQSFAVAAAIVHSRSRALIRGRRR